MTTPTPTFVDHWRREIYDAGIRAGMPKDAALLVAEHLEDPAFAPAQAEESWEIFRICNVIGAASIAKDAIKSGMPLQRVEDTLRAALPRRSITMDRSGLEKARFAFVAAGIVPQFVGGPSSVWRGAR